MITSWFPGHMAKSIKEINEAIRHVDILMVIIDSRAPKASFSSAEIANFRNKRVLLLLNKSDLSDAQVTSRWIRYYKASSYNVLKIDSKHQVGLSEIIKNCKTMLSEELKKREGKGLKPRPIRSAIIGIPNVGKSSLINALNRKKTLEVRNIPGVTKSLAWTRISEDFELLDTPGILTPRIEGDNGVILSVIGSIKDGIVENAACLSFLYTYLMKNYLPLINARYGINSLDSYEAFIEKIIKSRRAFKEFDEDEAYQILVSDIRDGLVGKISFEDINE